MGISTVQIVLLVIFGCIAGMGSVLDSFQTHRPLIACTVVGLILGDVKTGILLGGTLEMIALGWMNIGAAQSPDSALASIISTILVVVGHQSVANGIAIALPVAVAGQVLTVFARTGDKNVIKEALDLRDRYGGTVDVIGFGPLSAEDVMKETLTYGIDDAFLISDSQFADMDVSQVAKIVAAVIKKLGPYDLVLCGRQAIDGDSAHMASMTSCALEIPLIAYSDEITEMKDGSVFATCMGDQMAYKVEAKTPAMILSIREKNKNRFPSVPDIMKTYDGTYKTKILTNEDLNFSVTKRKVTQLRKYEVKSSKQQKLVMIGGKDEEEKAAQILQLLKQKSVI